MVDSELNGRIEVKIAHIESSLHHIRDSISDIKDDIRARLMTADKVHDDYEKRLRTLESSKNRLYGAAAGIGAVSGLFMSILFWVLQRNS